MNGDDALCHRSALGFIACPFLNGGAMSAKGKINTLTKRAIHPQMGVISRSDTA